VSDTLKLRVSVWLNPIVTPVPVGCDYTSTDIVNVIVTISASLSVTMTV